MDPQCRACGSTNLTVVLCFQQTVTEVDHERCVCGAHEDAAVISVVVKRLWLYTRPVYNDGLTHEWLHADLLEADGEVVRSTIHCRPCIRAFESGRRGPLPRFRENVGGVTPDPGTAEVTVVCQECDAPYDGPWSHVLDGTTVTVQFG